MTPVLCKPSRVVVLMTCYNRRETTLRCLHALFDNKLPQNVVVEVVLVDDGSTDGTAETVRYFFPSVIVEVGTGSLFWNRGMHRAQQISMQLEPDFVLWLNDDTDMCDNALDRMLQAFNKLTSDINDPVIIVGGTVDKNTEKLTYAGMTSASRMRRFQYRKIWNQIEPQECDVMNGNLVLIPRSIVDRLGNLDPIFEHAMGDIDYALRARKAGFRIFVAAGVLGYCSNNPVAETHLDRCLPLRLRWHRFISRKGLPPKSWLHFTRRHGGLMWPLYFLVPYFKFLLSQCFHIRLFKRRKVL